MLSVDPPLLQVESLVRRFGRAEVLRGISLVVRPGELHLVVGPNGAGKSTFLRLVAGLARPTEGTVRLGERSPRGDPQARREVGFLSHPSLLYDDLTPQENLSFAARLYGLADPEARARDQLAALDLQARASQPLRQLSRGSIQRVAIARALLHRPSVLLLDEPFTGLDAPSAERLREVLGRELADGRGVVLVSHDLHEAWALATRVHLLHRGTWVLESDAREGLDAFTARYQAAVSD